MRDELLGAVSREVAEFQSAADKMDEAVAQQLGINRTDLRCLGLLFARGALSLDSWPARVSVREHGDDGA
jgi:hypothetical protein